MIFNSVYFVEGMSFFLTLYILSNYLDIIGINSILIGVSGGIGTIPWVLKGIIGPLCDKFYIKKFGNRKQYIFVGAILSSVFFPLLIVTARPELLILFIFTWLIHNFGIILMDTNLDALCVETVPDSKDKTDANFWAFLGINLMVPIIATVFISQLVIIDYLFAFSVAGMISIVNIIIILFLREEKRETKFHKNITKNKQKIRLKLYFKQKFVLLSFIFSLFFTIHFGLLDLTLPIWLVGNLGIKINLLGYYQIFYGSMLLIGSICARSILRSIQKTKELNYETCANIIYIS
jgi:MFS family permease